MTLTTKAGIGAATVGLISGSTYLGVTYSSQQQLTAIVDLINERHDYKLLDIDKDSDRWDKNWEKYKKEGKNIFNLAGWKEGEDNLNLKEAFKQECKKLSGSTFSNNGEDLYEKLTKYCARGVTFEEQARKDGVVVFDTVGISHSTVWNYKFSNWDKITRYLAKMGDSSRFNKPDQIRDLCAKNQTKEKQITDFQTTFDAYKKIYTRFGDNLF